MIIFCIVNLAPTFSIGSKFNKQETLIPQLVFHTRKYITNDAIDLHPFI
jgi:hypothetical protein